MKYFASSLFIPSVPFGIGETGLDVASTANVPSSGMMLMKNKTNKNKINKNIPKGAPCSKLTHFVKLVYVLYLPALVDINLG